MKFLFWVAVIVLFIALVLPSLRFVFSRLLFASYLLLKKIFSKDLDFKYRNIMSVFAGRKSPYWDVAIYTKDKVFAVKFCGFFRKNTDVIVNSQESWQLDTYIFTGPFLPGTKNTKVENFIFSSETVKAEFAGKEVETVLLLLPKPKCFGIRNGKSIEWLDSGSQVHGNMVATVKYFRSYLKELI